MLSDKQIGDSGAKRAKRRKASNGRDRRCRYGGEDRDRGNCGRDRCKSFKRRGRTGSARRSELREKTIQARTPRYSQDCSEGTMDQKTLTARFAKVKVSADALSAAFDADVIFFSGDLKFFTSRYFVQQCRKRTTRRTNAIIIPITDGGSADAAYRIARFLQQKYDRVIAMVLGYCKSAGTLIVSGAHEIYMGDFGELGPLDVQISRRDEIWEASSGLNVDEAVRALERTAEKMYFDYLQRIKSRNRSVTYRTAAELSIELIGKLLGPISQQIDPEEIGENSRAMDITKNYATRLDKKSDNFKSAASIDFLVNAFPDHGFVIDRVEAAEIFQNVKDLTPEMEALEKDLGRLAHHPIDWDDDGGEEFEVSFLSSPVAATPVAAPAATPVTPLASAASAGGSQGAPDVASQPAPPEQSHLTVVASNSGISDPGAAR